MVDIAGKTKENKLRSFKVKINNDEKIGEIRVERNQGKGRPKKK